MLACVGMLVFESLHANDTFTNRECVANNAITFVSRI